MSRTVSYTHLDVYKRQALAFTGLVLLAGPEAGALHFSPGEIATLAGAVAIAAEIILIGHFASSVDSRRVTAVQLLTAGLVSFALMPVPVSYTHLDVYKRQTVNSVRTVAAPTMFQPKYQPADSCFSTCLSPCVFLSRWGASVQTPRGMRGDGSRPPDAPYYSRLYTGGAAAVKSCPVSGQARAVPRRAPSRHAGLTSDSAPSASACARRRDSTRPCSLSLIHI